MCWAAVQVCGVTTTTWFRVDILMDLGVYLVFHTLQGNSRLLCTLSRAYQKLQ